MFKSETIWVRAVSVSLLMSALLACESTLEEPQSDQTGVYFDVDRYVYVDFDGTVYRPYWLEKVNAFGAWEKVGLVFGYVDDRTACEEWRDWLRPEYNLTDYRCVEAE